MIDRHYLHNALRDAGRIELRVLHDGRGRSGIFDDLALLADAIEAHAATATCYLTLNAPRLMPATNSMGAKALTDDDIAFVTRLPFDWDSVRPKSENSSDDELAAALAMRDSFVSSIRGFGWPMPLLAVSGNGAHAVYRCRFPATQELREKLATIYSTLRGDFSDERVLFDSTVRNLSRIWRVYGTVNRKAPATPGRPQRVATCKIPAKWTCLSPQALDRFAAACEKRKPPAPAAVAGPRGSFVAGSGDYRSLDVVAWFAAHGAYKRRLPGVKHAVVCPWRHEHSDPDAGLSRADTSTVLFEGDGTRWPGFHCSHAHCEGRTLRDVLALWDDADRYCARAFQRRTP